MEETMNGVEPTHRITPKLDAGKRVVRSAIVLQQPSTDDMALLMAQVKTVYQRAGFKVIAVHLL